MNVARADCTGGKPGIAPLGTLLVELCASTCRERAGVAGSGSAFTLDADGT